MKRFTCTAWYYCNICKQIKHGSEFYKLDNGVRTTECVVCYDKKNKKMELLK